MSMIVGTNFKERGLHPLTASFAITNSCLQQSSALQKSVINVPAMFPMFSFFIYFSIISKDFWVL